MTQSPASHLAQENAKNSSASVALRELYANTSTALDIDYPVIGAGSTVCIGLTIERQHEGELLVTALRHSTQNERARAARFLRQEDGLRHLLGRALLRRAATWYGGFDATQEIDTNAWGKPQLAKCSVGCNISHSGTQVWVAISTYAHVGIDVESTSGTKHFRDISTEFHPDERVSLSHATDPGMATMRCWCRKEAVSKAIGMGLSLPLDTYAVDCDARSSNWLRIAPPMTNVNEWTTVDLRLDDNYVGALAVDGRCSSVTTLKLSIGS